MEEKIDITLKKLEELEKQTKNKFTKELIENLKKEVNSSMPEMFKQLNFRRIVNLIEHESKQKKLEEFKKNKYKDIAYNLRITRGNKKRELLLNGQFSLSDLSGMIQRDFDLEPFHLYEFSIGKYKFGPECDEWMEMFDCLEDINLGAAISAAGLDKGGKFNFLYDFGDRIKFSIEIIDSKKLSLPARNG